MAENTNFFIASFPNCPAEDFILQGDASVIDGVLSLTKPGATPHSAGRFLYAHPIKFWEDGNQAIFLTTITFKIVPQPPRVPAHGITFFIGPVDIVKDPLFDGASLGIFDAKGRRPNLFAVECRTYVNDFESQLPGPHIGIDIESWLSKATTPLEGFFGKMVTATIIYRDGTVTVVAVVDADDGVKTFKVDYEVDLKSVFINPYVGVGISAATGDLSEDHFIYSWSFASALVRDTE